MEAGTPVRLVHNPSCEGVLTGRFKSRGSKTKYQVRFPEGLQYFQESELEPIDEGADDPYELLSQGRLGRSRDFRRSLTHVQLNGRLANVVYSMGATNTEFLAYQYKPVLTFLESPSNGLLIADEVGLGKTIEAGLIWTELRARYDARRVLIVCPAMLREKWKAELERRFAVNARICNAEELLDELSQTRQELPDGQGLICSLQGLRPPSAAQETGGNEAGGPRARLADHLQENADEDALIDLLIVDEAHYLRNPSTQSAKLARLLSAVSEHVLLLTATPINLHGEDLYHLLNLVDPDTFDNKHVFPQVIEANAPLHRARERALDQKAKSEEIREALEEARAHELLQGNRQLNALLESDLDAELRSTNGRVHLANRIEKINLLRHTVNRTRRRDVTELCVVRKPTPDWIPMDSAGLERELYDRVTETIRRYAIEHGVSDGFLLATPQRQLSSCMYAAVKAWMAKGTTEAKSEEQAYEDFGIEAQDIGASPLIKRLQHQVLPDIDLDALRRHDAKYDRFRNGVQLFLQEYPKEKIVVFSYFRPTIRYLAERLAEENIRSQTLMGGAKEGKQAIIDRFRDDPECSVLLSTEVASEGVDLQFSRFLVNYDLPWNPMKVEQRIGRIDRIGQEAPRIVIWNLIYEDTIDERIYRRLHQRLNIFERALGGLENLLGDRLARLTTELFSEELTAEEEANRIEQTALAVEQIRKDQEEVENQASHLIAHSGYIMEQVQAAQDFRRRITPEDLFNYVRDYLEKYAVGHELRQVGDDNHLTFKLRLPTKKAADLEQFIRAQKLFGQTRLASGETCMCRFLNRVNAPSDRVENISQIHPLVRFIGQELDKCDESFYPAVALWLSLDQAVETAPGDYAFFLRRWTFEGLRVEEELRARAARVDDGTLLDSDAAWDLVSRARLSGEDWLSVKNEVDLNWVRELVERCEDALDQDLSKAREEKEIVNRDRIDFQVKSAQKHRDRQAATLNRQLEEYERQGRKDMVRLTQGKIDKLEERLQAQIERLEQGAELRSHPVDICVGVIRVA